MPGQHRVAGGVDTPRDPHTATTVDSAGWLVGTASLPATQTGYGQRPGWLRGVGGVGGVEGTCS